MLSTILEYTYKNPAVVLTGITVLVSLLALWRTIDIGRMHVYQRIHEKLVDPEVAYGRRRIFLLGGELGGFGASFPLVTDSDEGVPSAWDIMNQSLAWYDTLGVYLAHRYVPRAVVLSAWKHPLVAIAPAAYRFLNHRARQGIQQPWGSLKTLILAADSYECSCEQCVNDRSGGKPTSRILTAMDKYPCKCTSCATSPQ